MIRVVHGMQPRSRMAAINYSLSLIACFAVVLFSSRNDDDGRPIIICTVIKIINKPLCNAMLEKKYELDVVGNAAKICFFVA